MILPIMNIDVMITAFLVDAVIVLVPLLIENVPTLDDILHVMRKVCLPVGDGRRNVACEGGNVARARG